MSEKSKKIYIILILVVIAVFGTFINSKPINLDNINSIEIIYNGEDIVKNINDVDGFVNSINNEIKKFTRMIYNGSKDWQLQINFKGDEEHIFIIQDNEYVKINEKWYKTNTDLYKLINDFLMN